MACNEDKERSRLNERDDERIGVAMLKCGVGKRFISCTFDNYEVTNGAQREAFTLCQEYGEGIQDRLLTGAWLLLTGKPGTGKGHLAAAIVRQAVINRMDVCFLAAPDMFRLIKASWRKDSPKEEQKVIDGLCIYDLLVIDEVGLQFKSETEQRLLWDVLNGRYKDLKPVVMTTNLPWSMFVDVLGPRNEDRFVGEGRVAEFTWESYRRKPGKAGRS